MFGYIHRVAYYNGFKNLAAFISHLTGKKCLHIPTRDLMASRELYDDLCSATHPSNSQKLRLHWRAALRAGRNGFTASPRVCPVCFDTQAVLKHQWLLEDNLMCHEHGEPIIEVDWVKLNTKNAISWESLKTFCQDKALQSKPSALENLARLKKATNQCIWFHLRSYFLQRHIQITACAMLPPRQRIEFQPFSGISTKEQFQEIINILSEPPYMSTTRAYELTYWGVVDALLEVDRLDLTRDLIGIADSIDYCKYQFINDFPPPEATSVYCDIKYPRAFHQLKLLSPSLSLPWLNLLDKEEIHELAC